MLEDKLHLISKYNIQPGDISILINEKPVIDSVNEIDKNALLIADIIVDSESNISITEIKKAQRVVYWKTGETEHAVNIIGIVWIADNIAHSFKAQVLSP